MSVFEGLDARCPSCDRPYGDHTLREWSACVGKPTMDLPYEAAPQDATGEAMSRHVGEMFGLASDVIVADHVVVRALVLSGTQGAVALKLPAVMHEFQTGVPGRPPQTLARVVYIGNGVAVRKYGRLVRDSSNGAANAAER